MNGLKRLILIFAMLHIAQVFGGGALTAREFAKLPQYTSAALSINGSYLALQIPEESDSEEGYVKKKLVIIRLSDRKPISVVRFALNESVERMFWDNDERLIILTAQQLGWDARPHFEPNIYAINADGGKKMVIYGPDVEAEGASRASKKTRDNVPGEIVDRLVNDDSNILVRKYTGEVVMVNIYTAAQKLITRLPSGADDLIVDQSGHPLYATGTSELGFHRIFTSKDNEWERVEDIHPFQPSWSPIGLYEDGVSVYIETQKLGPTSALAKWDPKANVVTEIFRHPVVDFQTIWSRDRHTLLGVETQHGYPQYTLLNSTHVESKILEKLYAAFPKQWVKLVNLTNDSKKALVHVSSSTSWGKYYLYDIERNSLEFLVSFTSWLDKYNLAEMNPVEILARDGMKLYGYITFPTKEKTQGLPMVLLVHGGPHGPRDEFRYDPEVQFFASKGYVVLQVNYRGSGGYGKQFEQAGYRKWGREMQNDLTDSTLWAIKEGIADKNKICIVGASYGGYAVGMGLVREPDLYRCGVGGVGVYDLTLMYEKGDIQRRTQGQKYLERVIGTDETELKVNSSVYNVDKINKPVFLWQGGLDERVPPAHYFAFADALKKSNKQVELLIKEKEGHGFVNEQNRTELFEKVGAFLEKHLGN